MTEIRLADPLRANTDKGFAVKASRGLGLKGDCLVQVFKRSSFQVFKDTRMAFAYAQLHSVYCQN